MRRSPPPAVSLSPLVVALAFLGGACTEASGSATSDAADAADAAQSAGDTVEVGDTREPVEYVDDSNIALDLLNAQRLASNLEVLTLDPALSAACAAHVAYMRAAGRLVREEDPSAEGYSLEGAAAAKNALLASRMPRASDAAVAWTNSLYHRVIWLEPGVSRVGFAYAEGYACLDVLSAWAPVTRFVPVLYPGRDQVDVPPAYTPDLGVSPLPASLKPPTGVVVSLLFPPEAALGVDFTATLVRVDCAAAACAGDAEAAGDDEPTEAAGDAAPVEPAAAEAVDVLLKLPLDANDPYSELQRNAVVVIPRQPLAAGARYEVTLSGLVDAVDTTRSWQFTTRAASD